MAKLKATTYKSLAELLVDRSQVVIGNNTTAEWVPGDFGQRDILIRLHKHPIVRLETDSCFADGSGPTNFTLAGYGTVTTRDRINQFISNDFVGVNRVHQKNHIQMLNDEPIDTYKWIRLL